MRSAAIITAAGSGSRMGLEINKVLLPMDDKSVIETTVQAFANLNKFQKIIITHSPTEKEQLQEALKNISTPVVFVEGGSSRQKSVYLGLKQLLNDNPDTVLIHDAARPWITEKLINSVLYCTEKEGSSVPVIPSVNAMKVVDEKGKITAHLKRETVFSAQTPQGFHFRDILDAHKQAETENFIAVDDTELWGRYKGPVSTVTGDPANIKITYKEDLKSL